MTKPYERPLRIGAVSYLNSKPLIEGLDCANPDYTLVLDYPSCLADDLARGTLDVALVPSIECFRNPDYEVVSDACVAARGSVRSVKLYSRVPIYEIRSVALDVGSRTSAALTQILLTERFGIQPTMERLAPELSTESTSADAILLIGDRAFAPPREEFIATWDLGEEWFDWTGLPFVFAMWAARADTDLAGVEETLRAARDQGCQQLEAIARREADGLTISEAVAVEYLTENLYYQLARPERDGLDLFHHLAIKHGLAPEGGNLVFRSCPVA